jgi:nucleoside-diphosphate-sugar epimerase
LNKEKVLLLGASGTMGYAAFMELWKRRDRYDIVILVRPSQKNKKLFRGYEREAGVAPVSGRGGGKGDSFKIVWGDATEPDDVETAVHGVDWVLNAMAFISPQADYYPELAQAVNHDAIVHIVRAIEAQPNGAEHIKLIHTGTVAETGDRLGSIHWGRVGDPLKPSIFDYYAVTKIAGERAVLESDIKHWASLRMTYIMPTDYKDYASLRDPIMFHQPIDSFMENLSDRDAGYGLVNCLDIPADSDFWRRVYNMGGGPGMRCTAYDYADWTFQLLGLSGIEACAERHWFALRNFHMQYYEDSDMLNEYLHHWRDDLDTYGEALFANMPVGMMALAFLCRRVPLIRKQVEKATYQTMKKWLSTRTMRPTSRYPAGGSTCPNWTPNRSGAAWTTDTTSRRSNWIWEICGVRPSSEVASACRAPGMAICMRRWCGSAPLVTSSRASPTPSSRRDTGVRCVWPRRGTLMPWPSRTPSLPRSGIPTTTKTRITCIRRTASRTSPGQTETTHNTAYNPTQLEGYCIDFGGNQ